MDAERMRRGLRPGSAERRVRLTVAADQPEVGAPRETPDGSGPGGVPVRRLAWAWSSRI
jgi:hypothetical protein